MKRVLIDYIGSIEVTPQQINESMDKNNGKLIVSGIMQRASNNSREKLQSKRTKLSSRHS